MIARRKHSSDKWELYRTQYKGNVRDAHNSISIIVDKEGFIHMSWDHHNSKLNYCKSLKPEIPIMGDKVAMTGANESSVTYPEFYCLPSGDILFAYRDGGSGNGNLILNKYDHQECKWERIQSNLIDGGGKRNAYWQIAPDKKGNIHISWVWRETPDVKTNHDLCYAFSDDSGLTWKKSSGEKYELPISEGNAEIICHINQGSNLINQTSMVCDNECNPYIATYYKEDASECTRFHVIYKDHSSWKNVKTPERKTDFELGGFGSRSIPISRPQIIVEGSGKNKKIVLVYRDEEIGNHVCLSKIACEGNTKWEQSVISPFPVDRWEPSYDTYMWGKYEKLNLYFQKTGQGQGETMVEMEGQPVYILEVKQ